MDLLSQVEKTAKETPPVDNAASRFGNPAFRTFYDKVSEVGDVFFRYKPRCLEIFSNPLPFSPHYRTYRQQAYRRSRYISTNHGETGQGLIMGVEWNSISCAGCGHCSCGPVSTLNLLNFRICLERLGVLQESDHIAVVLKVFWR